MFTCNLFGPVINVAISTKAIGTSAWNSVRKLRGHPLATRRACATNFVCARRAAYPGIFVFCFCSHRCIGLQVKRASMRQMMSKVSCVHFVELGSHVVGDGADDCDVPCVD
jgi:hypothetical protein